MAKKLFIALIILLAGAQTRAQNDFCGIQNISFANGERLFFKVYYNIGRAWVGAGEATFDVKETVMDNHNVYHVVGEGKTLKSYDWFYKVRDRYETFIDTRTLLPVRFIRNVNEGGFKIHNNVAFNHEVGKASTTNGTFLIPKCVQDVLSAIYYARNIDYNKYQPGDKIPFTMFLDDQVYTLYIRYVGKERIETKYGVFNTIRIVPLLIEGTIFKGGEKMSIWVSDDNNHLPVRIDSPILVGSIKVDLMGYNNLRNQLTSLVRKK